ncbi:MAG TPA: Gfo/Idh/MocA family oxidoreductase [Candidatus Sulfotelmatobacter sp.]|jgi:predicted dehydrogenase|nr:Gfo/Idh/MocA family oxidoreductase [Candidatus Sulfotelmatobacter sp.]
MITRRKFLDTLALSAAGVAVGTTAKSYGQIVGSNDRLNFAVIGLNGRGYAHLSSLKANRNAARIASVCDVDTAILQKFADSTQREMGETPRAEKDFRRILEQKDVDAVTIATPDHWHTPIAIAALKAGKHVYVEKPCSHNPAEGEMLLQAQRKYQKLVQMGTQQRSSPHTIEIVQKIHSGIIGRPYYAKAWYVNVRKSIGIGKEVPVPPQLDWDLWQGPAPRRPYKDNVHPYNWHWFRIYGTGETLNNGTHEVDVCRWALGADYPKRVTSSGGRYHFKDDWQFYDTLVTSFEYDDQMISWEGKSCEGMKIYGRDRGSTIMGTNGSVLVDRDGYEIYDLKGKKTSESRTGIKTLSADLVGRDSMTDAHFANFIAGIRKGEKLNAPIEVGNVAVTMLQLSNIAWEVNRELHLDPADGKIQGDPDAMRMWGREYEKGWAPEV